MTLYNYIDCNHLTKDAEINKVTRRRPINDGIRDDLTGE